MQQWKIVRIVFRAYYIFYSCGIRQLNMLSWQPTKIKYKTENPLILANYLRSRLHARLFNSFYYDWFLEFYLIFYCFDPHFLSLSLFSFFSRHFSLLWFINKWEIFSLSFSLLFDDLLLSWLWWKKTSWTFQWRYSWAKQNKRNFYWVFGPSVLPLDGRHRQ